LTRPAKKSRKGIVAPDHGSPKSTVKKALKGSRSSSKSISEIDGHKPIKEALKGQANIELKGTINSEIHQVEAEDLIIARKSCN